MRGTQTNNKMNTNNEEIQKQANLLREVMENYNSFKELHQEALGPHFHQDIFDRWFTQQIRKEVA